MAGMGQCLQEQGALEEAWEEERELGLRLAAGDVAAFEEVVQAYGPRLARLANRLLGWEREGVQDVVQEVFVAAYAHCKRFRAESSLGTWLTRICINACRAQRRREWVSGKALRRLTFWRGAGAQVAAAGNDGIEMQESAAAVQAAVRRLPAKEREAVVLYYLEELPVARVAEVLRVSPEAVNVRLHRARQRLAEMLGPEGRTA